MSYSLKFVAKNLITNKDIEVEDGNALLPLFNVEQYKIRVYYQNSSDYTRTYRKSVRWDFGDGTIVEGASAEHYYKTTGRYTIRCTFYNVDRKPIENEYTLTVYVKEVIPIKLNFANPDKIDNFNLQQSKISNLLTLESSVNANVKTLAPIMCNRISAKTDNSYFKINKKKDYHLGRYYTFLKENIVYNFKKNAIEKNTLSPVEYYIPDYSPVYVRFLIEDGKIIPQLKVYIENEKVQLPTKYIIFNPNYNGNNEINVELELERAYTTADLADMEHCGWISSFNIWYKDDYAGEKDIYFTYDTKYFQFYNNLIDINSINIPPLGIKVNVEKPSENLIYGLTPAGLMGISDNSSNTDSIIIEKHLLHNFYINYTINGYLGEYIKNDTPENGIESWSLLKDNKESIPLLSATNCELAEEKIFNYISKYTFTPTAAEVQLTLKQGDVEYKYNFKNLKTLRSIIIPEKQYKYINLSALLDAYMPHPMFDEAVNLKEFFHQIFDTNNLFENINNKGFSFFDDIVNHKTCYINNLQSILEMFGSDEITYNISSFDKINELRDLVRILSMQYTDLFGRFTNGALDIAIKGDRKGASVGDRILPTDIIACDYDKNIIGIIRNNTIYSPTIFSQSLILHDTFTDETRLIDFMGVESNLTHEKHEEFLKTGYYISHYYSLSDYTYEWGWNLQLPAEAETSNNLANIIDANYSFYLYIPSSNENDFKHNYLDKSTYPYVNNRLITPEQWYQEFSYTYDCLMKILIYKLGLD